VTGSGRAGAQDLDGHGQQRENREHQDQPDEHFRHQILVVRRGAAIACANERIENMHLMGNPGALTIAFTERWSLS
jgi:hypothetical protein